ncbi:hypothetical protein C8F01DRAFT_1231943 [Mycena amicta]|nr:hypothetical protein C8F01DRAFT_1231943 [Mycena amicta]
MPQSWLIIYRPIHQDLHSQPVLLPLAIPSSIVEPVVGLSASKTQTKQVKVTVLCEATTSPVPWQTTWSGVEWASECEARVEGGVEVDVRHERERYGAERWRYGRRRGRCEARRGEESRYGAMRGERRRYEAAEYNFKVGQSSTEGLGGKELGLAKIQAEYLGKEMTWEKREASGVDPALGKAKWSGIRMGRTSVKPEEMVVKSPDAFDHRMMHDAGWPDSPRLTVSTSFYIRVAFLLTRSCPSVHSRFNFSASLPNACSGAPNIGELGFGLAASLLRRMAPSVWGSALPQPLSLGEAKSTGIFPPFQASGIFSRILPHAQSFLHSLNQSHCSTIAYGAHKREVVLDASSSTLGPPNIGSEVILGIRTNFERAQLEVMSEFGLPAGSAQTSHVKVRTSCLVIRLGPPS